MIQLRPCPFCGSEDLRLGVCTEINGKEVIGIECNSCALVVLDDEDCGVVQELVDKWNRRKTGAGDTAEN